MSPSADLRLDWCSASAAKYAVKHWHYSGQMPTGKLVKIGVWEGGEFLGCVLFGRGATPNLAKSFKVPQTEICELVRIALRDHRTPVSRIIAISIKMLRRLCPGLRLIVSFADPTEGHVGAIYQASNWVYTGRTQGAWDYWIGGRWRHQRGAWKYAKNKLNEIKRRRTAGKFRYLKPLDPVMERSAVAARQPYPKQEELIAAEAK